MKISLFLMIALVLITGCRQSAQVDESTIRISVFTEPILPTVGMATVIVRLSTPPDNTPINNAQKIAIKGDMTHAGMVPVLAETTDAGEDGYYRIPFNFNMAGDWILTVTATLADGTTATHSASVAGVEAYVPNFETIGTDCAIADADSTETPDCLLEDNLTPIGFGIAVP